MKRVTLVLFILLLAFLTACAPSTSSEAEQGASDTTPSLLVSGGDTSKTYTRAGLEALPITQSVFNDVTYVGVSLAELLQDAGFTLDEIKAVKAIASDGYSVNYDPSHWLYQSPQSPHWLRTWAKRRSWAGPVQQVLTN